MASVEARFSGSVPASYDQYLVPLLFRPYAEVLAERAARLGPGRVLETAAGTGAVTEALSDALPDAQIVATDLNQGMLDIAARKVSSPHVSFRQADALNLPFPDASFDVVVCQFGIMFFPDKVQGNREARRVLRDGGTYLLAIWDRIERNPMSNVVHETMQRLYPDNPPMFMKRGPFSYADPDAIENDLRAAGFTQVEIEAVERMSHSPSAEEGARGLCYGSPMRVELEDYGPDALDRTFAEVVTAARQFEGPGGFEAPMSALIVTATK